MQSRPMLVGLLLLVSGCSSPTAPDGGAGDGGAIDTPVDVSGDAALDASGDAGLEPMDAPAPDAASCLATHLAGERSPTGDGCNFCECNADGSSTCTARTCPVSLSGCSYDGTLHGYGERFPATDGCNECVCAASGLACTRRACTVAEEGAILLESPNEPCGRNSTFTAANVLSTLPVDDFTVPFLYGRARAGYPEVLPDTALRLRLVYDGGFLVCRLPSADQPSIDIGIIAEWITEDGAFDEGLPAYLRRNDFGFVNAWQVLATAPLGGLSGTYTPVCSLDPGGYTFSAMVEPSGHATGSIDRVCETDLTYQVGAFDRPAP